MNFKYFLRGLGTGIIFTVTIFMFSLNMSSKNKIDDEEIIKRAKELGMEIAVHEEVGLDIKGLLENNKTADNNPDSIDVSKEVEESNIDTTAQLETANNEKIPPKEQNSEHQEEYVDVEINLGMLSNEVASQIHKLGVIDDPKDFDEYLIKHDYQSKIIAGKYKINRNSTYTDIIKIITK